ncbi:hypothetical protein ACH5RR_000431 [Cinchona calisaya]|uniref:Uncharacterized protein n=1 Tax=Cinchona calisaya TaxID=153742 RepID=A0ABD3B160_9GENT
MVPELELKGRPDGVTGMKENEGLSADCKDKYQKCESNCEDHSLEMKDSFSEPLVADENRDMEVDVTECTITDGNGVVKAEDQDATESLSLSSFDDTVSCSEDAANTCDAEVGSDLQGYNSSGLEIDGFSHILRMRKKKLTSHWRTFIKPLIWRCKWVELQVKKLRSQALKYDRELENRNQRKHYLVENFPVEGLGMKSLPFPSDVPTDKVFKRKKRRRVEEPADVASYMSHHNLFSFYENTIRNSDGAYVDKDWRNQDKINGDEDSEVNDERLWLESGEKYNSLHELLRKIGHLEAQVSKMKSRLDKVINEHTGKFSSADNLGMLVPSNLTSSCAQYPASPPNNGYRMPVGSSAIASQIMSHYNMGNVVMSEGAISSHGEVSYIPDVIEGTDQSHLGAASIKTEDEILIYDDRLKQERENFDEVSIQPMEKPQAVVEQGQESSFTTVLAEPDLQTTVNQPSPKVLSVAKLTAPKNRRKRGRRKASSARWSRRSSG